MLELVIKADYNDADYITETNTISEEDLELIKPLIAKIAEFPRRSRIKNAVGDRDMTHNYDTSGHHRNDVGGNEYYSQFFPQEVMDMFEELLPYGGDDMGIHTIVSIEVYPVPVKTKLL